MPDTPTLLPGQTAAPSTKHIKQLGPKPQVVTPANAPKFQLTQAMPLTGFTFPAGPPAPPKTTPVIDALGVTKLVPSTILPPDTTQMVYRRDIPPWSWDQLFDGEVRFDGPNGEPLMRYPPLKDTYSRYVLLTLVRAAFAGNDEVYRYIGDAFPGAQHQRVSPGGGVTPFDVWTFSASAFVYAMPGTSTAAQWLSYLPPLLKTDPDLPDSGWLAYAGLDAFVQQYLPAVKTIANQYGPQGASAIFAGHSAGGCAAQVAGWWYNKTFASVNPNPNVGPCRGVFTYGAPAWLNGVNGTHYADLAAMHVRTFSAADPIPYLTQVYTQNAALLKAKYFNFGLSAFQAAYLAGVVAASVVDHVAAFEYETGDMPFDALPTATKIAINTLFSCELTAFQNLIVQPHLPGHYADRLERRIRASGSALPASFPGLLAAHRTMDENGVI